ncbi:hypothetical protein NP493_2638g00005 [Ridgeia piscesae]|uniref:Uncharacterized protein n=1 Tax=Ridgeia piscesae TaxID=27915 RepID=A0AAD9JDU7_RIDPI|nr:hypothetical protein NP493_2638g00005 [Ridgeia piscesae]
MECPTHTTGLSPTPACRSFCSSSLLRVIRVRCSLTTGHVTLQPEICVSYSTLTMRVPGTSSASQSLGQHWVWGVSEGVSVVSLMTLRFFTRTRLLSTASKPARPLSLLPSVSPSLLLLESGVVFLAFSGSL